MDYITITGATGSANDFGYLSTNRWDLTCMASPTRGVIAGGYAPSTVNTMDYIEIASTGNAIDFGDLSAATSFIGDGATSNGHGGL